MILVFGRLGRITSLGWPARIVSYSKSVEGPVRLVASLELGKLEVKGVDSRNVSLAARLRRRGKAELSVEGGTARALVSEASAVLEAPLEAAAVAVDAGALKLAAPSPLRYLAVSTDSGSAALEAALAPGSAVVLEADSGSVTARLKPSGPGEYTIKVVADSSSVKVRIDGPRRIIVEEVRREASGVKIDEGGQGQAVFKVKVVADSSSVKID